MTERKCDIKYEKRLLRKEMRRILSSLDPIEKAFESARICLRFIQSETYKASRVIFGFMPLKDEVDILPVLRAAIDGGKKVLLPKIAGKAEASPQTAGAAWDGGMDFYFVERDPIEETESNALGIFEPKPSRKKADIKRLFSEFYGKETVVLVPGLAFTKDGLRLGRGGGYYDVFLEKAKELCAADENARDSEELPRLLGVCYGAQVLKTIPCESHDIKVDALL